MAQQHNEDHSTAKSSTKSSSTRSVNGITIANLPPNLKVAVDELDLDANGDGQLDTGEIIMAVEHLAAKTKANTSLKKIVYVLCGFSVVLVAALFGASIAAARLAKDTTIDPVTGIMYAKDSDSIMKTEEAKFRRSMNFALLSNQELDNLIDFRLTGGDVKFQVKGYARNTGDDAAVKEVMLLVDGGTITYDPEGIIDATGDAERLLTFAYGNITEADSLMANGKRRRRLQFTNDFIKALRDCLLEHGMNLDHCGHLQDANFHQYDSF
jgi:hypothetical protein